MRIVVSGASGLVGSSLVNQLKSADHEVVRLVRRPASSDGEAQWNPAEGDIDRDAFAGADAVVHLAGKNIAGGRWTPAFKDEVRSSRVDGTRLISTTLAGLDRPPSVLICASATGYYGDRGDEVLTEDSAAGEGYLPEVCVQWEAAADPARDKGIRVVHLRYGVILAAHDGALKKMLLPFKLGMGGKIGSGKQYMPWLTLTDAVGIIRHAIDNGELAGPVNAVAPEAVTNLQYTKALGRALGRPTVLPMPAFGARLAFGEMAEALLLASTRVEPKSLGASGYSFQHPQIDSALKAVLAAR